MKLNIFYGDTKYGIAKNCDSFDEAEKIIRESAEKPCANIKFNDGDLPNIELNINGDRACLTYNGKIGECLDEFETGVDDDADDDVKADMFFNDNFYYPTWIAHGDQKQPVKFLSGRFKKMQSIAAERVITLDQAIECVKDFFNDKERSTSIAKWERLI